MTLKGINPASGKSVTWGGKSDGEVFQIHNNQCLVGIFSEYWCEQTKYNRHFIGNVGD